VLPQHLAIKVPADKIRKDVLASGVEGPHNLTPRDGLLLTFALNMLAEEEQETARVGVNRTPMLLNYAYAFYNVCEAELLTTGQQWNAFVVSSSLRLLATSSVTDAGSVSSANSA
jgi:hypothetical protein